MTTLPGTYNHCCEWLYIFRSDAKFVITKSYSCTRVEKRFEVCACVVSKMPSLPQLEVAYVEIIFTEACVENTRAK